MENINDVLARVPEHLLRREVLTKKSAPLSILHSCDEFGGVKFYNPNNGKMGYKGPVVVQDSINKAREKYNL